MRRPLLLAGGLCCLAGLALGLGTTRSLPGGTLPVVALVLVLSLVGGTLALAGVSQRRDSASPPPVEVRRGVVTPGAEVDRLLDAGRDEEAFDRLRVRILREATARHQRRTGRDVDPEELAAAAEDPLVAAFCRGDPPTRGERVRALLAGEPATARRARRAIDALLDGGAP